MNGGRKLRGGELPDSHFPGKWALKGGISCGDEMDFHIYRYVTIVFNHRHHHCDLFK